MTTANSMFTAMMTGKSRLRIAVNSSAQRRNPEDLFQHERATDQDRNLKPDDQ